MNVPSKEINQSILQSHCNSNVLFINVACNEMVLIIKVNFQTLIAWTNLFKVNLWLFILCLERLCIIIIDDYYKYSTRQFKVQILEKKCVCCLLMLKTEQNGSSFFNFKGKTSFASSTMNSRITDLRNFFSFWKGCLLVGWINIGNRLKWGIGTNG